MWKKKSGDCSVSLEETHRSKDESVLYFGSQTDRCVILIEVGGTMRYLRAV